MQGQNPSCVDLESLSVNGGWTPPSPESGGGGGVVISTIRIVKGIDQSSDAFSGDSWQVMQGWEVKVEFGTQWVGG